MTCTLPAANVVAKVALPFDNVPDPMMVPLSLKSTEPVGTVVTELLAEATVAVNVVADPVTGGFGDELNVVALVVLVAPGVMESVYGVGQVKLLSPLVQEISTVKVFFSLTG